MSRDPWREARAAWERLTRRPGTGEEALDALSDVGVVRRLLDQAELEAVRVARRDRKSWAEIATRLGVSRQSAWERWRELDDEQAAPEARRMPPSKRITVPNVVGMSWPVAQHRLLEERLHAVVADQTLTPFLGPEAGDFEVIDQKPTAGERVAPDSPVTLWLHRGPGSAGDRAPLPPPPEPRARRGAVDVERR